MKKMICAFSFVFCVMACYSQNIIYGLKGGLNLKTFTANYIPEPKLTPSFHVGGFVNFLISEKITLQPEVLFSGKGGKYEGGSYNFGYINVPVLVQYNSPSGFFLEVGPQVGLLMYARQKIDAVDFSGDVKDQFKSVDFSWLFGMGYKIASGIGLGARYDFGYYNIVKSGVIKNKTVLLSLFYTFGTEE